MRDVFGCARCAVPLECSAAGPDPQDILRCPSCGIAEVADVVRREIDAFRADQASRTFEDLMRARLPPGASAGPQRARRSFRFIPLDTGGPL